MGFRDRHIINLTLREGEQFVLGNFSLADKVAITSAGRFWGGVSRVYDAPQSSHRSRSEGRIDLAEWLGSAEAQNFWTSPVVAAQTALSGYLTQPENLAVSVWT